MEIIPTIQSFVNMQSVLIAVVVTQAIKYFLPAPPEASPGGLTTKPAASPSFTIEAGRWWTRLMPFCPVLIGMISCYFIERDAVYTFADGVRGFLSGALAAYLFRTTQVTIFGK